MSCPGRGLNVDPATLDTGAVASYVTQAQERTLTEFVLHIIPDTMISAFTSGEILQVLFVAILFGIALTFVGERGERLLSGLGVITAVVFRMVHILMYAAPIGAFGAMAFTIGQYGLGTLANLAALIATFYVTSLLFVIVVLGLVARAAGFLAARSRSLHQGRAAAGARHVLLRKRDAAADGEARAGGC